MKILYDKKNPEIVYLFCAILNYLWNNFYSHEIDLKNFDSVLSVKKMKILPGS